MSLKQASFDLHKQLSALSPKIKRSHCRELIAAAYRLKSMAAAESNGFIMPVGELPFDNEYLLIDNSVEDKINSVFINRARALVPELSDLTVFDITEQTTKHFQLVFISFEELVDEFEMSGFIEGVDESSGYWYRKRADGQQLTSQAQIDFADAFELQLKQKQKFKELLLIAADKGYSDATYSLSFFQYGTEKQNYLNENATKGNSKVIITLFEESGNEDYLYPAAMHGSYDALEKIVREFSENVSFAEENAFNAHYYNAIAEHYGYRLTQSSLSAVGDTNYDWDDSGSNNDYYGPLYAAGYEGIRLPRIDKTIEQKAINKAQHDLQNLNVAT